MINSILLIVGCFLIAIFWVCRDSLYGITKESKPAYESIQLIVLLFLSSVLIILLVLDYYKIVENFFKGLPDEAFPFAMTFFGSLLPVLILIYSILYGRYYVVYQKSAEELKKIRLQGLAWLIFAIYYYLVIFVLIILPMMNQLGS